MKYLYFFSLLCLFSVSIKAQFKLMLYNKISLNQDIELRPQLSKTSISNAFDLVPNQNKALFGDTINTSLSDTMKYNMYGDLLNDNPAYNQKLPLWRSVVGVISDNFFTNLIDTYILKVEFTHVGFNSWGHNLKAGFPWGPGWEWSQNSFGKSFLLYPYNGSEYFNSARANGYTFWESVPFTMFGSYIWNIFGKTEVPKREDLINTTFTGVFLGEILYRFSSNVLDDQSTGTERIFRELAAGLINPVRFTSRFLQGKMFNVTSEEENQKEPLDIKLATGTHWINNSSSFGTGSITELLNFNFDYGNPFEKISRKPYDYFTLSGDLNFGVGRKIVDAVNGYGILTGKNSQYGNFETLAGIFQYYDYFDNKTFELGTVGFGGGIISKVKLGGNNNLYTNFHLALVPFAGNSRLAGPDTSQFRDYDFGGGTQAMLKTTINLGGWVNLSITGYYYWMHTYVGTPGNNFIALFNPGISVRLFKNISAGFEQLIYYTDRYLRDYPNVHAVRTEQKLTVQFYIENSKYLK